MKTLILLSLIIVGCSSKPFIPDLNANQKSIRVGKADPNDNMELIGEINVISGNGCGYAGNRGTLGDAYTLLKYKADEIGAAYVQIITITEPHREYDHICFDNEYKVTGMAFKPKDK